MEINGGLAFDLAKVVEFATKATKKIETGQGLGDAGNINIPPDKMDEYKKLMAEKGVPDAMKELEEKLKELRNISAKTHGVKPDNVRE